MPGINGIFEPFRKYVQNQLNKRQETVKDRKEGEFYTYTTAKSCYLRMVSGVNIAHKNNILESSETPKKLDEGLAKQYILEGGTLYYDRLGEGAMRESFTEGKEESKTRGFTYGDDHVRADAGDNFGIVPMPGIVDAEIRTKTPEGSLREAKINFECHNRRQLQVLEALYMRPGYLVLLEWGWSPYIHSKDGIETDPSSGIARKFLDPTKVQDTTGNLFNRLNQEIIKKKQDTEGNYDGFIGIIKNFNYTSRDDGGYSCTTELIAQGEIMESLRSTKKFIETDQFEIAPFEGNKEGTPGVFGIGKGLGTDVGREVVVVKKQQREILDKFLLYLKSIKAVWDKTGDEAYLQLKGTDGETRQKIRGNYYNIGQTPMINKIDVDAIDYIELQEVSPKYEEAYSMVDKLIKDIGKDTPAAPDEITNSTLDLNDFTWENGWFECLKDGEGWPLEDPDSWFAIQHERRDWRNCKGPKDGGIDGVDYLEDPSKGGEYSEGPTSPRGEEAMHFKQFRWKYACVDHSDLFDGCTRKSQRLFKYGPVRKIMGANAQFDKNNKYNQQDKGLTSFYDGLIVQQISKYISSEEKINSGWRKNIFVRWDLVCQIFNHLSQNKLITDSGEEPIVEMTYLAPKQQTYDLSSDGEKIDNTDTGTGANKNSVKEYIRYQPPKSRPTVPGEMVYNDSKFERSVLKSILGESLDESVCLLPHQEIVSSLYKGKDVSISDPWDLLDLLYDDNKNTIIVYPEIKSSSKPFTSYKKCHFNAKSIGGVLFNLDFLITEYERISMVKRESGGKIIKSTINFNKYFNNIWEGVNAATGGYYDFGLHIEHERPHVGRIIDFEFSGRTRKDNLFTFKPQLDGSILRNFNFNSEIPSDMSSVISIAAQAPNEANDLDALSFKAFHKGIYSRFSATPLTDEEIKDNQIAAREVLQEEIDNYKKLLLSLGEYTMMFNNMKFYKINTGDKYTQGESKGEYIWRDPITSDKALSYIEDLEELRISIENKYPLYYPGGEKDHPKAGLPRENTTYHRSAIIPIKFSAQLDGIAGITPLTLFRVDKNVLPIGYQDKKESIVFIIKEEKQTITSGQDWVTEFNGQLVLQDTNPNFTGQNLLKGEDTKFHTDISKEIESLFENIGESIKNTLGARVEEVDDSKPGTSFQDPIAISFVSSVGDGFPARSESGNLHTGIDIRANIGTELVASRDGTVTLKTQSCGGGNCKGGYGGFGQYVILEFDDVDEDSQAAKALYAHLNKFASGKKAGDSYSVTKGQIIGYVGETGNTTGPHLHYEIGTENYLGSGYPSSTDRVGRLTKTYTNSNSKVVNYLLNAENFTTYY